jgi:hypothetical protein
MTTIHEDPRFDIRSDATDVDEIGERAGVSLLRYAAQLFDQCNEGINQLFTAEELLRIASACERSGWDIYPDQWTKRQLEEAARDGTVPQWVETRSDPIAVYEP